MGFAEIQAAFAANTPAPTPAPAAAAAPLAPSPFGGVAGAGFKVTPAAAPPAPGPATLTGNHSAPGGGFTFNPAAAIVQPPAPAQQSFTFTPPSSVGPAPQSFAPINPPGERAALTAPPATLAPPDAFATVTAQPAAEQPKAKRTRKAKFTAEDVAEAKAAAEASKVDPGTEAPLACTAAVELKDLPPDGSSVEDIVEELFARGVVRVHLEFTKDGMK
jgi:hypothetical protein